MPMAHTPRSAINKRGCIMQVQRDYEKRAERVVETPFERVWRVWLLFDVVANATGHLIYVLISPLPLLLPTLLLFFPALSHRTRSPLAVRRSTRRCAITAGPISATSSSASARRKPTSGTESTVSASCMSTSPRRQASRRRPR